MIKTIYLPSKAKEQLELSDSDWAQPMQYKENPAPGYSWRLELTEDELEYEPLQDGWFHPDRTEPMTILELLEEVDTSSMKKEYVKPGMKEGKAEPELSDYLPLEKPLTVDDFCNGMFDSQTPRKRRIPARSSMYEFLETDEEIYDMCEEKAFMNGGDPMEMSMTYQRKEPAIEGVTFSNNFEQIGFTYHILDGMLHLNWWDKKAEKNVRLLEERISCVEQFEKCIKKADKKIRKR